MVRFMKKRKRRLPRKLKKAIKDMRCYEDTGVIFRPFALGHYPRTKWVVAAERQFRRLLRELKEKNKKIKALEKDLEIMTLLGL